MLRKPVNQLKHLTWGNTEVTFNSETNCLGLLKKTAALPERAVDQNREGKRERERVGRALKAGVEMLATEVFRWSMFFL